MNEHGTIYEDHKIHVTVEAGKPWQVVNIDKMKACHEATGYKSFDELVEGVWKATYPDSKRSSRTERRECLFHMVRNNTGTYQLRYEGHIIEPERVRRLQSRVSNMRGKVMVKGSAKPLDKHLIMAQRSSSEVSKLRQMRKERQKKQLKIMDEMRVLKNKRKFKDIIKDAICNQASEALRTDRFNDQCYDMVIHPFFPFFGPLDYSERRGIHRRRREPSEHEVNQLLDAVKFIRNNNIVVLSEEEFDDLGKRLMEGVQ